jgi:thiamine-phosphate pyrophosphorylase
MFKLMVVTDRRRCSLPLVETVRLALEGGADAVQLRERDLEGKELYNLAVEMRKITRDANAALVINHRVDVALAVEADAVHMGWRSLSPQEVRELAARRLKIGVSCHSIEQLRRAEMTGATYVLIGPIFPTQSKEGLVQPVGLENLAQWTRATRLPVVGIGGINSSNFGQVLDAGACGIAAISAFMSAQDPAAAARGLLRG